MSIANLVAINVKTLRIDSRCSLKARDSRILVAYENAMCHF